MPRWSRSRSRTPCWGSTPRHAGCGTRGSTSRRCSRTCHSSPGTTIASRQHCRPRTARFRGGGGRGGNTRRWYASGCADGRYLAVHRPPTGLTLGSMNTADMSPSASSNQYGASDADVLVVGAGPTGLLLAGDLAKSGADVTLLERRDYESNLSRAFSLHARTLEQLDARGPADELLRIGTPTRALNPFSASVSTSPGSERASLSSLPLPELVRDRGAGGRRVRRHLGRRTAAEDNRVDGSMQRRGQSSGDVGVPLHCQEAVLQPVEADLA